MSERKILWVFGPTGVGKATLISKLTENENHYLHSTLGIRKPLRVSQHGDSLRQKERTRLDELLVEEFKPGTLLVKGQHIDYRHEIPQKILTSAPDLKQEFVFLFASGETIKKRQAKRRRDLGMNETEVYDDLQANIDSAKVLEKATGINFVWLENEGDDPIATTIPN